MADAVQGCALELPCLEGHVGQDRVPTGTAFSLLPNRLTELTELNVVGDVPHPCSSQRILFILFCFLLHRTVM